MRGASRTREWRTMTGHGRPPWRREDDGPAEDLAAAALTLARRFAAGATMWCVAPTWPSHGRHVAVEFVHPVIVGKRALPAVHIDGAEAAVPLRLLARPGDVLLVVSSADDPAPADLLSRAEAWGLTRVWLGAGPRPSSGRADHVMLDGRRDADVAARSGDLVLLYHLLWELTHVVFEHPGLLDADAGLHRRGLHHLLRRGAGGRGRAVHGDGRRATVMVGRPAETVDASLVDPSPRATSSWSTPEWRSPPWSDDPAMSECEPTGFLYPFIEAEERDAPASSSTWPPRPRTRSPRAETCGRPPSSGAADAWRRRARPWPSASAGGPALRLRQRRQRHRRRRDGRTCSATPRAGARSRPCPWWTTGPCSPRWPTTSASTWSSPDRSSPTPGPATSPWASRPAVTRATCCAAFEEAARRGLLTDRPLRVRRGRRWRPATPSHHCLVVRSDSVHRIQEAQDALMLELWSIVQAAPRRGSS